MNTKSTSLTNTRTFICIDFPSEIIKEVARNQHILETHTKFIGKLTELENLHLTLKFLGHISQPTLKKVKRKLSTIKFPQLNLALQSIGTFNYKGKPRIVWLKVSGNVFELQKQIDLHLKELFPKEERFMSHLTIARIKYVKDKPGFIQYVKNMKIKKIKFQINEFKLKSSDLQPQGPVYTTLEKYKLED